MRHWIEKFRLAFRGVFIGVLGQSSFVAHFILSLAVCILAWLLDCEVVQWCILLLCMGLVLSAELFNSAMEHLARGLCEDHNQHVGNALDIASGAVLAASIFAASVGSIVFAVRLFEMWR